MLNGQTKQIMIPITDDGKIQKEILQEGNGDAPQDGQKVKVSYKVIIKDSGKEIEKTQPGSPYKFTVGQSNIGLWSIGVKTMKLGETAKFEGEFSAIYNGKPENFGIKPDTILTIEATLVSIIDGNLSLDEAIEKNSQLNDEGAKCFHAEDFAGAIVVYTKALELIEDFTEDKAIEAKVRTQRNLSLTYSKVGNWNMCCKFADEVLSVHKDDLKSLMRKAESLLAMGILDKARTIIERALRISNNNPAFKNLKKRLLEAEKEARKRENENFAKMFQKIKQTD
ncbi:peptidyl-prolyl cis-trans isomerase, FKBP-type family protein [Histomonas meleagridis]|uniref:peptidyl-prolyl cis-trans isomerase, FKBP-type family protein n=1 Tax=Histomonas meleagridis TaxID=135588 RepID=UPI00355A5052|nr:peptidyl-prolyl cis-trans isomerase, FKBP-type family protein [Histomonas meleagridis]KAH0797565.1 peptidyl-prolyl cis-trans isomerase, FKBP-type family protein [Histomonas meleagridis]